MGGVIISDTEVMFSALPGWRDGFCYLEILTTQITKTFTLRVKRRIATYKLIRSLYSHHQISYSILSFFEKTFGSFCQKSLHKLADRLTIHFHQI